LKVADIESATKILKIETKTKKTLFVVTLQTEAQKWALIGKARKVSLTKDEFKTVFVNPDLTKSERDVQFELRKEVRSRRQMGEQVKISKGRVVVIHK